MACGGPLPRTHEGSIPSAFTRNRWTIESGGGMIFRGDVR
jgi:hypothetical protein